MNVKDLTNWWHDLVEHEIKQTVPKAKEYGSRDLEDIGLAMARNMGREDVTRAEAAELGVYFYVTGKMARWHSAVARGEKVSDDTLFDIGVYIKMVQRIRQAGAWK